MEAVEEERPDGRTALSYTHRLLPGVTQVENYGEGCRCVLISLFRHSL